MAEVLMFHHALGLTPGCLAFAEALRDAAHVVHAPDLYDGKTFAGLDEGVTYAQEIGFGALIERGRAIADGLPEGLVYIGFSLGVLPAQALAQTRPGARGAALIHACVPPSEFGGDWPSDVPVQIHLMESDEIAVTDGDLEVARRLADSSEAADLYLYPGDRHLFADSSTPDFDPDATRVLRARVIDLLNGVEGATS